VRGIDDSPPYDYAFNNAFGSAPLVAVTTLAGMDGNNGCWSMTYGPVQTTATTLSLVVDEDQLQDSERKHGTEQVGYVVFETPFFVPPIPDCLVPADCDDGLFCNGEELCAAGSCVSGAPVGCDDGVSCTVDSCNVGTDSCDNVTNDSLCDDSDVCTGTETCDETLDCQAGTPLVVDDLVSCTVDSCDPITGVAHVATDTTTTSARVPRPATRHSIARPGRRWS